MPVILKIILWYFWGVGVALSFGLSIIVKDHFIESIREKSWVLILLSIMEVILLPPLYFSLYMLAKMIVFS